MPTSLRTRRPSLRGTPEGEDMEGREDHTHW